MALSYLVKVKQIRSHASPPPQPGLCPLARPVSLLNGRRPGAWRAVAQRRWAILAAVACPGRASMSGRLVGRTGQFSGLGKVHNSLSTYYCAMLAMLCSVCCALVQEQNYGS